MMLPVAFSGFNFWHQGAKSRTYGFCVKKLTNYGERVTVIGI